MPERSKNKTKSYRVLSFAIAIRVIVYLEDISNIKNHTHLIDVHRSEIEQTNMEYLMKYILNNYTVG